MIAAPDLPPLHKRDAPGLSPALDLVVAASLPRNRWDLAALSREVNDWDAVIRLARWHGVSVLCHRRLAPLATVPTAVLHALERDRDAVARQSLALSAELLRVTGRFREAGIAVLALKGPALSNLLFASPVVRSSCDLDLLVKQEAVAPAVAILHGLGYRARSPRFPLDQKTLSILQRVRADIEFRHAIHGHVVELHWRWQRNPWLMRFDPARVWGGARPLPFFAQEIATPGAEELFIFLCVHGSRHLWTRLKWLVDIAWWMKDPARAATVAGALQRAKQLGAVHSLENAAELLERLSGMPQAWLPNEQRGRAAQTVADQVLTRWGQPRRPATGLDELSRKVWVEWILSDGWASRLRGIVWGRFVRPNDNDMETLLLPPALTPLYFPLKPILWLSRRFGAGSHGGTE